MENDRISLKDKAIGLVIFYGVVAILMWVAIYAARSLLAFVVP